jgi:L-ornithine Nalpha-acyltransferase
VSDTVAHVAPPVNAAVNDHEETSGPLLAGDLEVRLAQNEAEIDAAQSLRYRVFYEEMGATPSAEVAAERRDFDQFDDICDHLLVVDRTRGLDQGSVVGTYRLLRKSQAKASGRFYTADEYDISCLLAHEGEILELGRSCVDAAYRDRATVQLLLRGIGAYVRHHDITLMFGCASLPGVEAHDVAVPLSWLHYNRLAPPALRPRALPERYVRMNLVPREAAQSRIALAALPPLIKAYVRAGCFVGDGAVIDHQFRTIDICIVLEVDRVSDRFRHRYEGGAGGGHAGRA